jgi:integrase
MLEQAKKLRTPQMHAALAVDLNTGLRDKELREIRWEQIDLVHKKALTVGKSKTEAGTGRVIPLNETAIAAMEVHAAWYIRRFGACRPEWFVFAFGTPLPKDPKRPITTLVTELAESGADVWSLPKLRWPRTCPMDWSRCNIRLFPEWRAYGCFR